MSGNVWDALARELRELKRERESITDRLASWDEKIADVSARIDEARKGAHGAKSEKAEGSVSDF